MFLLTGSISRTSQEEHKVKTGEIERELIEQNLAQYWSFAFIKKTSERSQCFAIYLQL